MKQPFRFIFRGLIGLVLVSGTSVVGCASLGVGMNAGQCDPTSLQCAGSLDGGGGDGTIMEAGPGDAGPDANPVGNPLCASGCMGQSPDNENACSGFTGGTAGAGPSDAGPGADAAPNAEGGATPDAAGTSPDSGAPGMGDASTPSGDASPDAGAGTPAMRYGCFLTQHNGAAAAACEPAGHGTEHDPCVDSSDCAPGYGCVLDGAAGECRHFCCAGDCCNPGGSAGDAGDGGCDPDLAGTFCAQRPLKTDSTNTGTGQPQQLAPVCVPADNCNLAEPYPCTAPDPADCTCPDPGTACMVVGNGLTSCIPPPGTGKAGDPCPCAWGHVCSQATKTCLKICSLTAADPGCGTGKCQASKQMPEYFGVCIPSSTGDGGY